MAAAASATMTTPYTHPYRQRVVTILHGSPHYVTLSDPSPLDGNRKILLTPTPTDATNIHYTAITGDDATDGKDVTSGPHYVELTDIHNEEPGLLRPRMPPCKDMPTQLGTVVAGTTPTPIMWVRKPAAADDTYTLHLATDPDQSVIVSHTAGILPKKDPYLMVDTEATPAVFWSERVCETCHMVWTHIGGSNPTPCCSYCRAQAHNTTYIAEHGHPPAYPCRACGEDTPYGGYCSDQCRADYED